MLMMVLDLKVSSVMYKVALQLIVDVRETLTYTVSEC